ncbi:MAG: hypothetical protein K8I00_00770, partial [Candidatus Omnitrophica bacterium]|nr:hypothetical protein [Candidatus Omnitrophota bacterium]
VGFDQISKIQILATPENVSTLESFWGTPLEESLAELGLSAAEIRDALDFRLSGQTESYNRLVEQAGEKFVEGDIYRAFSNDLFDSILPENMRINVGEQEGVANAIRWIDYGDSFGYMADEELEDLLAYLIERAAYIRSTLAERLIQRIVEITEADLQRITANVFDELESGAFVPEQMRVRTDYQNARDRARQDFIEGFQQRQDIFRQFQSYLEAQDSVQFVAAETEVPVDAAILSDTMVTSPEQVREGMEALNRLLQRLPAELARQVGQDLNMIKVFSGVSAEVGFTQSSFQFIVGRLGEVERTILIEAIQADDNFAVLQPKPGVYSIVNKQAAREVIAANADLFPGAALRNPDWIVGESAQWFNANGPEWETRTIRYGLLSGIPRSAAEEFIRFDRTLQKFKDIFARQEDMIEYMAKRDIAENVKESGREHLRSVLIGYDVTEEEIDLIIDTAVVGNKFQMLAFNPSHREWVTQAETLLEEGAQYLAELRPQTTEGVPPAARAASGQRDAAVLPDSYQNVGGIDLSPQNLKLLRQGQRIELNLTPVGYENIEIRGLTPVIFQITPVTSLPLLLGQLARPAANPNPA